MDHPAPGVLERYRLGTADPDEIIEVADHVATCPACARSAGGGVTTIEAAAAWQEALQDRDHLSFEEMVARVEQRDLDDRAAVAAHLASCAMCTGEVEALRDVRPRRRGRRAAAYGGLSAAAAAAIAAWLSMRPDPPPVVPPQPTTAATTTIEQPRPPLPPRPPADELAAVDRELAKVASMLLAGKVPNPDLLLLVARNDVTQRGGEQTGAAAELLAPSGVIRDDTPTFRWKTRDGKVAAVKVFDLDLNPVAETAPGNATSWTPATPFARGKTYEWQLVVGVPPNEQFVPSPPSAPARFHVISNRAHQELHASKSSLEEGLILAREGMLAEAADAFARHAAATPGSTLAPRLARAAAKAAAELNTMP